MGGHALREPGLTLVGRIAAKTGARPRADAQRAGGARGGAGRCRLPPLPGRRCPYSLAGARHLVLVGCKAPVAFFAYPDKPSALLSPPQCETHTLATSSEDIVGALEALAEELGALQNAPVQARDVPTTLG